MHLLNGALSPECVALTWAGAATGVTLAVRHIHRSEVDRSQLIQAVQLTGVVFAAQMINIPLLPHASTHLVGGALLAWRLGPCLAAVCMTSVLIVQAALLGDGGFAAFGANVINMALIPAMVVAQLQRIQQTAWTPFLSGWLAVILAALALPLQIADGNTALPVVPFGMEMLSSYAVLGLFEGFVTAVALAVLSSVYFSQSRPRTIGLSMSVAVALLVVLPFSSSIPDGYEAAAEVSGLSHLLTTSSEEITSAGDINVWLHGIQVQVSGIISKLSGTSSALPLISFLACSVLTAFVLSILTRRPPDLARRLHHSGYAH